MIREATAMTTRQNLGKLLNEVQYRRDSIVITKSGKAAAALIDFETLLAQALISDGKDIIDLSVR
jgi:prevent-host-death family protein